MLLKLFERIQHSIARLTYGHSHELVMHKNVRHALSMGCLSGVFHYFNEIIQYKKIVFECYFE